MKIRSVVQCSVIPLSIAALLALPAAAQPAGKGKLSPQTFFGVACSDIFKLGIDKQENLRATMIRVACGLDAPGEAGEVNGSESVEDFTNINLITGTETFPNVTQSESMVWSTPDGQTIVVNYNDSRERNTSPIIISSLSVSFDGGQSFERIGPQSPLRGHGDNFGDPIVVYNVALSKWFAGDLVGGCGGSGIGFWTSDDAMTWTVGACAHNGGADDRESMWVDNNAGSPFFGRMYVSWNDFAQGQNIFVVHSDDGIAWSAPVRVQTGTFIRNIQLTGSPDDGGTVFIAGMDEGGGGVNPRVNWIYRSIDGGNSWTPIQQGPAFAPPGEAICGFFAAIPPIWRHMGWGQPGVGPGGVVHYVYAARGSNPGDEGDILYIRSDDNGDTWSAPITLNTDAAAGGNRTQWMPSLSVTPEGNVVATWYDRRSTTDFSYEYWIVQSPDNGQTWGSDQPVSDVISPQPEQPDPGIQSCYVGDYNYQSAVSSNTWVTWADGRVQVNGHNQQDVFFAAVPQVTTGGTLQGTVTDTTGGAVAGARVQAVGPVTRTAATRPDGTYRLTSVPEGSYDMTVTHPDHNPGSAAGVMVVEGQTTTQNFVLTGAGILQGVIADASGAPLAGVRVDVVGPVTRNTTTDSSGSYSFRLPVGTYDVTATATDYDPGTATVDVLDGMITTQNFTLTGVGTLEGTVMDSANAPIAGALVQVVGPVTRTATTDTNGFYRFRLRIGTYNVTVTKFAYDPGTATVDVLDALTTTQNFTLTLSPTHSVSGTITNLTTGLPIAGATVRILNTPIPPATTNASGMYLFPSVPEGTYDIQASAPGFVSQTQPGVVVNQDVVVNFGLDSAALCDHVAGNLVANCGFETGDFTSWTRSGDLNLTSITPGAAHSGSFGLFTGTVGDLGFIAQNLATTPGGSYSICYWLQNPGGNGTEFQVFWGGAIIRDDINAPQFPYTMTCLDVVAPGDVTELKFGFRQDPSFWSFDDVSVAAQ